MSDTAANNPPQRPKRLGRPRSSAVPDISGLSYDEQIARSEGADRRLADLLKEEDLAAAHGPINERTSEISRRATARRPIKAGWAVEISGPVPRPIKAAEIPCDRVPKRPRSKTPN